MKNKYLTLLGSLLIALIFPLSSAFSDETSVDPDNDSLEFDYGLAESYNSFAEESGWADTLWGRPFSNRLYLGMWTVHFQPGDDQENVNNLLGLTYNGYFVGTFRNTHRDQVVAAGWHRALYKDKWGIFDVEAGYRLGLMYGYTKFLPKLAPLPQAVIDIDYDGFGIELAWAGVVFSGSFYYRF